VKNTFGDACVVGVGVPHDQAIQFASRLGLVGGRAQPVKSVFHAGEVRKDRGGDLAYVGIAVEGAG